MTLFLIAFGSSHLFPLGFGGPFLRVLHGPLNQEVELMELLDQLEVQLTQLLDLLVFLSLLGVFCQLFDHVGYLRTVIVSA